MGVLRISFLVVFTCWALSLRVEASCNCSGYSLKLLGVPPAISRWNSATFAFESFLVSNGEPCTDCRFTCKLDDGNFAECEDKNVTYGGLKDGNHLFEVYSNGSQGVGCTCYNWTVDTVPPTANLSSSTYFTNALNITVTISFSEPCPGGGGFRCSSVNGCNLLVDGDGQVIPSSLRILQPNLIYSLLVSLNSSSQFGKLVLFMDKDFCNDIAGNGFMQTTSPNLTVRYDRRSDFAHLTTHVPEQMLQLDGQYWTVLATNDEQHLRICLYFSQPILNSSTDIRRSLNISAGNLVPLDRKPLGNRRFEFMAVNEISPAVVTVTLNSSLIMTREGNVVSEAAPITFLYATERPAVIFISPNRTRERIIPISIKFTRPVFSFNQSHVNVSGGNLTRFNAVTESIYEVVIEAQNENVSVHVPENVTVDVAGNKNEASELLEVWHYTTPTLSSVVSTTATASFLATASAAGLLSISTASLQLLNYFANPSPFLTSEPSRHLFRMAGHIQVFALTRWLAVELPVEYYELARGIKWSIPSFSLPWEAGHSQPNMGGSNHLSSSKIFFTRNVGSETFASIQTYHDYLHKGTAVSGPRLPLQKYKSLLGGEGGNNKSEADDNGWRDFGENMFWLAVIGGSLILLHALLLLILKYKKKKNEKQSSNGKKKNNEKQSNYGALSFPRFEIFLLNLALPSICRASANVIRGGTPSGIVVGTVLLGLVAFALLAWLLFLTRSIAFGNLFQYEEVHPDGQNYPRNQKLARATLGTAKRGQWTWKKQLNSVQLILLGPLFEDLRGPAKYMLSPIFGSNPPEERVTASNDETEDAEAPFIQKLFGALRIYYPLLESIQRVSLGIFAGAYPRGRSSRTPTITLLCITCFQLLFLILKKPFIRKGVQLVEIISLSTEVGLLACYVVLLRKESSGKKEIGIGNKETGIGIFMVVLFLLGFIAQMVNELCALYRQTKRLSRKEKSFFSGVKVASFGLLRIFLPDGMTPDLESCLLTDQPGEGGSDLTTGQPGEMGGDLQTVQQGDEESSLQTGQQGDEESSLPTGQQGEEESSLPTGQQGEEESNLATGQPGESIDQPGEREPERERTDTTSSTDGNRSSSSQSTGTTKRSGFSGGKKSESTSGTPSSNLMSQGKASKKD